MDGVLVHERSSWGLVHEILGTTNEPSHEAYLRGEIDDLEFMRRDIAQWLSIDPHLTVSDVERMLRRATPMAGADRCLAELKGLGATISILSGGLKLLSRTLAERWGFDSHFANGLEHGPDGRLTGEGILEVPLRDKGGVLVNNVMAGGGFGPVITVGDSIVDISMFKRSDLAIAFRPKDERVTRRAQLVVDEPDLALVSCAVTDWLERHEGHSPPRVPQ